MTIEVQAGATAQSPTRRLRLGMVGGGEGAFIGAVHAIASRIDNQYELVAGALSSDPERARRESPFGTTIAHGALVQVLMSRLKLPLPDNIFHTLQRKRVYFSRT